jgi:hypothetical protein
MHCRPAADPTTGRVIRFSIDDGVNEALDVDGQVVFWECLGADSQAPEALRVRKVPPIAPVASVP